MINKHSFQEQTIYSQISSLRQLTHVTTHQASGFACCSEKAIAAHLVEIFQNKQSEGKLISGSNISRSNKTILPEFRFTSDFLFIYPEM